MRQDERRARRVTRPKALHYTGLMRKADWLGLPLSDREIEVYARVVDGWENKQIAEDMGLACGTIKELVYRILSKLGTTRYRLIQAYWKARSWEAGDVPLEVEVALMGGGGVLPWLQRALSQK